LQATLLLCIELFAQASSSPGDSPPQDAKEVVVELRNGSRIAGTLREEDGGVWVVGVSGGELRLAKKSVLRIVPKEAPKPAEPVAEPTETTPATPAPQAPRAPNLVTIELHAPAPMSFQVPDAWAEKKLEGRDLALTDPTQSLLFGVTTVSDPHSLWNFTRAIKRDYQRLYRGFAVEREKFSATASLQSWEVEFRYQKDDEKFREVHLMLDFGDTKRIFSFTAAAARFEELFPRFRNIIGSFTFGATAAADCAGGSDLAV
jgi:hypothetical protein